MAKHGIDFEDARRLWRRRTIDPFETRNVGNEERRTAIGRLDLDDGDSVVAVVYTVRDARWRIISARRASRNEREHYGPRS